MERFTSNLPSPITDDEAEKMHQRNVKGINGMSSTPVTKPARESLAGIRKNTVSGMVNRFTQMTELTNYIGDRKPPVGRQVSLFNEFSIIKEASQNGIDSKLNSIDSGYGSFQRRSQSFNTCSVANRSKSVLANYKEFPNFQFSYLKYFGVEPKKYLSTFGIDFDSVSDSVCNDSSVREVNGGVAKNVALDIRKRSHTVNSKRTFDSTSVKVKNLKYLAMEQSPLKTKSKKNDLMKVVTSKECADIEDVCSTKVTASRDAFLEKSIATQTTAFWEKSNRSVATQTPEPKLESVDPVVVLEPEHHREGVVDTDLKSRIQKSIHSYNNMLKTVRNVGIRKKKRTGSEAK